MKKLVCLAIALVMVLGLAACASAEFKFERKIDLVCPWGVGGGADSTLRPMATLLQDILGVPVEVVNVEGGSGVNGVEYTYKQPADGYTAEMPVFEPSAITITGPEVYINSVSYAWVTFGEDGITSTYSVDTGYTLMDSNGDECSTTGITCSTDTVKATLPLLMVKEVPLTVDTIEGAGATSANTVIKIEPSSITLAGDTSILAGMNKIVLGTIDLTDFTDAFQNTYSIVLDNEVRNLTGITEAKVTVEIIGLETRDFTVTNLSCINDTEGYKSTIITESLTVTLRGTKEQLDAIQSENIRAVADLKDFKESSGTYMVPAKVYVAGYDDVGAIGDVTMSVEIRKA